MTLRSLAASAATIALLLAGTAFAVVAGEATSAQTAPLRVAVAQDAAPDFVGISNWFNSKPLNIADLRGKVVLVDFWTYGCVNCVNTLPHVTELYAKYKDRGLVVVGIHTPEFPFEHSASNVQAALKRHGITYPVGAGQCVADLERLPQPVLAGAIYRRPERQDRVPARRRRPVRADRPHDCTAAQRQ